MYKYTSDYIYLADHIYYKREKNKQQKQAK